MNTYYKLATETLDYTIDWTNDLGADTIASSIWSVSTGITSSGASFTTKTTKIYLSGGTTGEGYVIENTITTVGGLTLVQQFAVVIGTAPTDTDLSKLTTTGDDIIRMALEDVKAYAPDFQDPTPGMMSRCKMRLNAMLKGWQAAGVGLWLNEQCTLPLQADAQSYTLGPTGSPCVLTADMIETTLSVGAASGASTITVTSSTGMAHGYSIGIQLSDNSIQWTTINGPIVAKVVTLTTALTAAASAGATVFCYLTSNQIGRPLGITEARIRDVNGNEVPLYICSRDEYMQLPLKSSTGKPAQVYYDAQMNNAKLYVWPVDTTMSDRILFTGRMPIQIFRNLPDNPNFPDEWVDALHFNLALRLSPMFDVPADLYAKIKEMAIVTLKDANDFDREQVSVFFAPGFTPGRG